MQRLRVTFGRGEETRYLAHLDLMRFWERVFRRAHLSLAISKGFHPHPRFALAAPLPVGVTSEAELMDVFLEDPMDPARVHDHLSAQMTPGVRVIAVQKVELELPSLQSQMRFAEYLVMVETDRSRSQLEEAVAGIMGLKDLPWEHLRDGEPRRYNLRAQIDALWVEDWRQGMATLGMRLKTDSSAAGRPEQVTRALGCPDHPVSILRTLLILAPAPRNNTARAIPARPSPDNAEPRTGDS